MKYKKPIDYSKIYKYLKNKKNSQTVTSSMIAQAIGIKHVYGGTMNKLAKEGWIYKTDTPGYWFISDDVWKNGRE